MYVISLFLRRAFENEVVIYMSSTASLRIPRSGSRYTITGGHPQVVSTFSKGIWDGLACLKQRLKLFELSNRCEKINKESGEQCIWNKRESLT